MKTLDRIKPALAAAALALLIGAALQDQARAGDDVKSNDDTDTRMNKADLTESLSESSGTKKSKKAEKKARKKAKKKKTKRANKEEKKKEKNKAGKDAAEETAGNDNNRQTVRGTDL